MRDTFLPFSPVAVGEAEALAAADAVRSGWLTAGPRVAEFEEAFARAVDAKAALAVGSCTAALRLALAGAGVGPGDEVITSTWSFAASVGVIEEAGATPVLVDVEADTLNIDPAAVARAVTEKTKAILPVHFAGHPADLVSVGAIAEANGLSVIEDAAHSFPASYRGRPVGSGDNPTAFSFYATKNVTTGEGGALTGDPTFIERVRPLALHGISRDAWERGEGKAAWYYEVVEPGFKANMADTAAAIGLVQLGRLDQMQARRKQIVDRYMDAFSVVEALEMPTVREEVEPSWHLFVVRLNLDALRIGRDRFIEEMRARNVGTSVHFIPMHLHRYYGETYGYAPGDLPVAFGEYQRVLSLPLTPALTDDDVADVIEAVLDVCASFGSMA